MNYFNLDLKRPSELKTPVLDSYDIETLLLEVSCNITDITPETVKAQALLSLKSKYETAIEIIEANLNNIVNEAKQYRNI